MKKKYKCLDLFCGGGGASLGYEQAGFEVVGVDNKPQPNYKGQFIKADAIAYVLKYGHLYDFIHASPPCQKFTPATGFHGTKNNHINLIPKTRKALVKVGKPYIIENVEMAKDYLINPILLCGTMFDSAEGKGKTLRTYRHRLFESNMPLKAPKHPEHTHKTADISRMPKRNEFFSYVGHFAGARVVRKMTGLHNLTSVELAQSIPPQYTAYLGKQVMNYLKSNKNK